MIYSVWDYDTRKYRYYKGNALPLPPVGGYRKPKGTLGRVGYTPEDAAAVLPAGATLVGDGADPKGIIASKKSFSLSAIGRNNMFYLAAGGLFGYWFSRFLRKRVKG